MHFGIWPIGHIRIRGIAGLWLGFFLILIVILIVCALLMMYMICSIWGFDFSLYSLG